MVGLPLCVPEDMVVTSIVPELLFENFIPYIIVTDTPCYFLLYCITKFVSLFFIILATFPMTSMVIEPSAFIVITSVLSFESSQMPT